MIPVTLRAQAELELRRRKRDGGVRADNVSYRELSRFSAHFEPHSHQLAFIESPAKRKVIRAGRRGGKTVGAGELAARYFEAGKRVLYAVPTQEQVDRFWATVKTIFQDAIDRGLIYKNETRHILEIPGTETRIRAKTAWNADTLRGDYADLLILDEWQLMDEEAWGVVGAPMMADHDGDAVFIYTPPSLHSRSVTKARDPQHAAKLYKRAAADESGRWAAFHFKSADNPYISADALDDLAHDMTALAYRMEILAEDVDEAPGALWTRQTIETSRLREAPDMERIVVAIDPTATAQGDEAGIIGGGRRSGHGYVLRDGSKHGSPLEWATAAVNLYRDLGADLIVAEANNGGEMVKHTIHSVDPSIPVRLVWASRGKQTRAEPVAAYYEQGKVHHVGSYPALEDEMCLWMPGDASPNRMDAMVWLMTDLLVSGVGDLDVNGGNPFGFDEAAF